MLCDSITRGSRADRTKPRGQGSEHRPPFGGEGGLLQRGLSQLPGKTGVLYFGLRGNYMAV